MRTGQRAAPKCSSHSELHRPHAPATALAASAETFSDRAAIATLPPARRDALNLLADWAETLEREGLVRLFTARGNSDTTLRPYLLAKDAGLVSIVCGPRSSFMQFWPSVFQRRAPHSIPAVEAALGAELKQGISTHEFPEPLLDALTLAYRETAD